MVTLYFYQGLVNAGTAVAAAHSLLVSNAKVTKNQNENKTK